MEVHCPSTNGAASANYVTDKLPPPWFEVRPSTTQQQRTEFRLLIFTSRKTALSHRSSSALSPTPGTPSGPHIRQPRSNTIIADCASIISFDWWAPIAPLTCRWQRNGAAVWILWTPVPGPVPVVVRDRAALLAGLVWFDFRRSTCC